MRVLITASSWIRRHNRFKKYHERYHAGRTGRWEPASATAPDSRPSDGQPDVHLTKEAGQTRLARTVAMLKFMGPALILPLSDPLMSLIDAVSLGRVCSHPPSAFDCHHREHTVATSKYMLGLVSVRRSMHVH